MVGPRRIEAARMFGALVDDARVTSYEDFGAEVDLSTVVSLGLVVGPETTAFLAAMTGGALPEQVLLGMADEVAEAAGRDALLTAVTASPALRPAEVVSADGVVLVRLGPVAAVDAADTERALATLSDATQAPPRTTSRLGRLREHLRTRATDRTIQPR
ncbi:hypothetical protein EFK50_17690 [Nocardioides marmoriginsengisoli]|uniref:Uncharacterized protein n=1 Tax=Nocardioides marmoriginsengisoli TaxID=661483 RepID=A0A3N0CCM2_9ACTN|nr:hypothetical protein EFK50_17690 [Nocardioides marmoriginsengisoli]